jgi:hypothetical protein
VAVTVADWTAYTDTDVDTVYNQLWPRPALEPDRLYREMARAVLDALVAAGWVPRRALAKEFADALHAHIARSTWMSPAYRDGMRDAAQYAWPPFAAAEEDAAHRRQVAEEIAQAIEAYDGPLSDGPRTTLARIARAHGETGHG